MNALIVGFVVVAGALTAVQPGANAQLVRSLDRPWAVSVLVSLVTAACFLAAWLLAREAWPEPGRAAGAPWWAWTGGVCGAVFVSASLFCAGRLGSGAFTGLSVTAGIVASLAIDHFGLVGFAPHPAGLWRILGGALMVAGVALVAMF